MIRIGNLCAAALLAVLVSACGSGGGDYVLPSTSDPSVQKEVPAAKLVDVTFVNVPASPGKTSVIPGERDVEVAAFRTKWTDPQERSSIGQLVFKNNFPISLSASKNFKLLDGDNDVNRDAPYIIRRDDERRLVIVDFYQFPWFPNDFDIVPKTYSLLASMDPSVAPGTTFSFELVDVQMHDAGKSAASEVKGRQFKVSAGAGDALPIITVSSSSSVLIADHLVGSFTQVGSFTATCSAESTNGCTLTKIRYSTLGTFNPAIVYGTIFFGSDFPSQFFGDRFNEFDSNISWSLAPGVTQEFPIFAQTFQTNVSISIIDMTWLIGGQNGVQTKVNAVIPSGPASCGQMVSDGIGCKG